MPAAHPADLSDDRLNIVSKTIHKHFDGFLSHAKTRSLTTVQSCEKERASIVSSFDHFYEDECVKVHPDLPATALTVMKRLHEKAEESIQAMFNTCSASQHRDLEYFRTSVKELESNVTKTSDHELRRLRDDALTSRQSLMIFKRLAAAQSTDDQPPVTPDPDEAKEDNKKDTNPSPESGGVAFEAAYNREKKASRTTSSQAPIGKDPVAKPNSNLPAVISPLSKNGSIHSPMKNRLESVFRTAAPGNFSPSEKSPRVKSSSLPIRQVHKHSPSGTPQLQAFNSPQPRHKAFESTEIEDIHPVMRGPIETGSQLNQEYEEKVVVFDDYDEEGDLMGWKDVDEDEEQRPGAEELAQRHGFSKLSAMNDRLVEEKDKLSKENDDLREKNDKFEEMINDLMNLNKELKQDNEELRQWSDNQGQPADDLNQTGGETGRSAQTELESPRSPEETGRNEKVDFSVQPPTKPSLHNPSTGTTYPLTPAPSYVASPNGASRYPDTATKALVLLQTAVERCNTEIKECQKDIKIASGHETSPKYLLERWQSSTTRHCQDFHKMIAYLRSVLNDSSPPKYATHASFGLQGGSPDSLRSPPKSLFSQTSQPRYKGWDLLPLNHMSDTSEESRIPMSGKSSMSGRSSMFGKSTAPSSMASSIFSGFTKIPSSYSQLLQKPLTPVRGSPGLVSSQPENVLWLTGLETKSQPESTQESSPVEGSSIQQVSSSRNEDRPKQSQSQPQSQNSQKSIGSETSIRGNKSAPDGKKSDGDDDEDEKKPKRGKYQPLLFQSRSKPKPWRSAIFIPFVLLWNYIKSCVCVLKYLCRLVRHIWRRKIKRSNVGSFPEMPCSWVFNDFMISTLLLMSACLFLLNVYTYIELCRVRLALQGEWAMWLDANGLARELILRRIATQPSRWSLWGFGEEQGLGWQSVGDFVEFACWALGFSTLKEFVKVLVLNLWALVCGFSFLLWNRLTWVLFTTKLLRDA